jgi:hypothetical protein
MHIPDGDASLLRAYRPREVIEKCLASGAESVMIYCQSHVGLCYWPTAIGTPHAAMGGRDWLGESLAALREAGSEAYGYYSVIFNNAAYLAHPEWRIVPRPTMSGGTFLGERYGHVCPNNAEYRRFVEAQIGELFARYAFDGFFFDMTFWPGICECAACRNRFSSETGASIPRTVDWNDALWCRFQRARESWMVEFAGFLTGLVKRASDIPVYHNFAVALFNWTRGISFEIARHNDFLGGDFYGDRDEQFLTGRFMLNLSQGRPIEYMTSRCVHITEHVNTKSAVQLRMQAFAALTSSAAFRLIDAIEPAGTVSEDIYAMFGEIFERIRPYESYLGGEPVEDVAVYLSDCSKMSPAENGSDVHDPQLRSFPSPHLTAARAALTRLRERRLVVGAITREQLGVLARYKVILLCEATRLSAEEVDALSRYVAGGGSLYVSGASGTYTLDGKSGDFQLRDCLGLSRAGKLAGDTFYLRPVDAGLHELARPQEFIGLHDEVQEVSIRSPTVETLACLTLPYGYPHKGAVDDRHWASIHSSPPGVDTALAAIALHGYGKGKVIYAAVPLERSLHHAGKRAFQWSIDRLLDGRSSFRADTFDHVWLTVFHQAGHRRFIIHLLNYPAELPAVPVRDVRLEFGHGLDYRFASLRRLPDNREIAFSSDGAGRFSAVIDTLDDYMMLVLAYD